MCQLETLPWAGKDHAVLTNDVAAPKRGEPDVPFGPGPRFAIAGPDGSVRQRNRPPLRSRLAQHQRRA